MRNKILSSGERNCTKSRKRFRNHHVMEFISEKEAKPELEDYKFIERRISQQYLNQYHDTYALA